MVPEAASCWTHYPQRDHFRLHLKCPAGHKVLEPRGRVLAAEIQEAVAQAHLRSLRVQREKQEVVVRVFEEAVNSERLPQFCLGEPVRQVLQKVGGNGWEAY